MKKKSRIVPVVNLTEMNVGADGSQRVLCYYLKSQQFLLILLLSLSSLIAIVAISAISMGFFSSAILNRVEKQRVTSFSIIATHTQESIKSVKLVSNTASQMLREGAVNVADWPSMVPFLWSFYANSISHIEILVSMYGGLSTGEIGGYWRVGEYPNLLLQQFSSYDDPKVIRYIDVVDKVTGELDHSTTFDFNLTSLNDAYGVWYQTAKSGNTSQWTESYTSAAYPNEIWLTYVSSIRNKTTNEFIGYFGFDSTTKALSGFLQDAVKIFHSNVIVILERNTGNLIATSDPDVMLYKVKPNGETIRSNGENSGNQLLSATVKYGRTKFGALFEAIPENPNNTEVALYYDSFKTGSNSYLLNIASFNDRAGINWIILQAIPKSEFYSEMNKSIIAILCISAGLVMGSFIVSIVAARLFMKPLLRLVGRSMLVQKLQLDEAEASLVSRFSVFSEIRTLEQAFLQMVKRLKQFKAFIPDHVLVLLENEGIEIKADVEQSTTFYVESSSAATSEPLSTIWSGSSNRLRKEPNRFSLGLSVSEVSVVSVKLMNLSEVVKDLQPEELALMCREWSTDIQALVRQFKGQIISANHDTVLIGFNTVIVQRDHLSRSTRMCLHINRSLSNLILKFKSEYMVDLVYQISVVNGMAHSGYLGNEKSKYLTVLGKIVDLLQDMHVVGREWGTSVLLFCENSLNLEILDRILVHRALKSMSSVHYPKQMVLYQLGQLMNSESDHEWMYEMEKKNELMKWENYNEGYRLYEAGSYEQSLTYFEEFIKSHPDDTPANIMISHVKTLLSTG